MRPGADKTQVKNLCRGWPESQLRFVVGNTPWECAELTTFGDLGPLTNVVVCSSVYVANDLYFVWRFFLAAASKALGECSVRSTIQTGRLRWLPFPWG